MKIAKSKNKMSMIRGSGKDFNLLEIFTTAFWG